MYEELPVSCFEPFLCGFLLLNAATKMRKKLFAYLTMDFFCYEVGLIGRNFVERPPRRSQVQRPCFTRSLYTASLSVNKAGSRVGRSNMVNYW